MLSRSKVFPLSVPTVQSSRTNACKRARERAAYAALSHALCSSLALMGERIFNDRPPLALSPLCHLVWFVICKCKLKANKESVSCCAADFDVACGTYIYIHTLCVFECVYVFRYARTRQQSQLATSALSVSFVTCCARYIVPFNCRRQPPTQLPPNVIPSPLLASLHCCSLAICLAHSLFVNSL